MQLEDVMDTLSFLRWRVERERVTIERMAGLAFALLMSGLLSRYLRDPTRSAFDHMMGTFGVTAVVILAMTLAVVFWMYRRKGMSRRMRTFLVYLTQVMALLMVYVSGFLLVDAVVPLVPLAAAMGLMALAIELSKERLDVPVLRIPGI